jgi:DNA replication protein DnaC
VAPPPVPTEELEAMLTRLRLPAIRDRLDALLEEAARRELNLRETLAWLCAAEVARKEQLRMEMALRLARFPYVRTLEAFDFEAQPSLDPAQIRELATCRWVANGDTLLLLAPPVWARPTWRWPWDGKRCGWATASSTSAPWN